MSPRDDSIEIEEYAKRAYINEMTEYMANSYVRPKSEAYAMVCRVVADNDDVMLIENGGVIIRIPASSINIYKRDVQGVIVMRIEEGNQVVSLERVENMDETEETAE